MTTPLGETGEVITARVGGAGREVGFDYHLRGHTPQRKARNRRSLRTTGTVVLRGRHIRHRLSWNRGV